MLAILYADTPPNVCMLSSKTKVVIQEFLKAFRSLGENLKYVPVGQSHNSHNFDDVIIGHIAVEEVAHRIHKHHPRHSPFKWLGQFFRNETEIKTLLVGVTRNSAKTFSKCFGIAVLATGTDLGTTAHWIPSCVGPFDFGV